MLLNWGPGCDDHVEVLDVLLLDYPGHLFWYGVGLVAVVELLVVAIQCQEYCVVAVGEKLLDKIPAICPLLSEFENIVLLGRITEQPGTREAKLCKLIRRYCIQFFGDTKVLSHH